MNETELSRYKSAYIFYFCGFLSCVKRAESLALLKDTPQVKRQLSMADAQRANMRDVLCTINEYVSIPDGQIPVYLDALQDKSSSVTEQDILQGTQALKKFDEIYVRLVYASSANKK